MPVMKRARGWRGAARRPTSGASGSSARRALSNIAALGDSARTRVLRFTHIVRTARPPCAWCAPTGRAAPIG
eukprot:273149-Prymnesium_polylepis.1